MSNPEPLTRVITAFEQWRQNKSGRQKPIPAPLRKQAVLLLDEYSSSKITSALKISGSQLKQWTESLQLVNNTHQFVDLPLPSSAQPASLNVQLHFRHGGHLTLGGDISVSLLTAMIQEMKS